MIFLLFGKIPPPIGGVTISVKNLKIGLESLNHTVKMISISNLFCKKKFDIGHIHYSRKSKVIIAILLSKILCKRTIVTKHGLGFYPKTLFFDKIILMLTDGMIVLNNEVLERCSNKKNLIKLPPIFKEGIIKNKNNQDKYFIKKDGFKYLLIYASGKVYIDNKEVYGINFTLEALRKINNKNIVLIVLDPKGEYKDDISQNNTLSIIYIEEYVNFNSLLDYVDLYIRPTSSDGNSIATLEALSQGVPVLASDIVERDENIQTYRSDNQEEFIKKIESLLYNRLVKSNIELTSINNYIDFCLILLKERE